MRFLADEGISPKTIEWLRQEGHDVISVREQSLFSLEDRFVLASASDNQAILLTRDVSDFSRISHLEGVPHHGIILLRPGKDETAGHINLLLSQFLQKYSDIELVT